MANVFKYLLLIVVGLLIILGCSIFQHVAAPVKGEYYYSSFLRNNYTVIVAIIFFSVGLGIGYYSHLNPWLAGICLHLIFPITSLMEAIIHMGTHNLIPVEFGMHFIVALPTIIAVILGRFVFKRMAKRRENISN